MFGKFKDIGAFLDSYVKEQEQVKMDYVNSLPANQRIVVLRSLLVSDVAEVKATVLQRQTDDNSVPKHYQMTISLNEIMQFSPGIKDDIFNCEQNKLPVFLAIRFGDREGIAQPINAGMDNGNALHLKGQWIPKDKAYSHGGEKMSVLHFTHHPIGFTCTLQQCYS